MAKTMLTDLAKIINSYGFQKCGTQFICIRNSLALGIGLDRSGLIVYCTVYILPLYMPSSTAHYTYGNRLGNIIGRPNMLLEMNVTDNERNRQLAAFDSILNRIILPYFNSICSPEDLLAFISCNSAEVRRFLFCTPTQMKLLQLYTRLFLHKTDYIEEDLHKFMISVESAQNYSKTVKDQLIKEANQLLALAQQHSDSVDTFFMNTICATKAGCFPSYKN